MSKSNAELVSIPKTESFDLDAFKSTRPAGQPRVAKLQAAFPIHRFGEVKDFWRVHPASEYCVGPLCLVHVPIKDFNKDQVHLILEHLADQFLPPNTVDRRHLILATKPHDVFFLGQIPHENLDNAYNADVVEAVARAKHEWLKLASRRSVGGEGYELQFAIHKDFVDDPNWPMQDMKAIIENAFQGRMITTEQHPALLRLTGRRQKVD